MVMHWERAFVPRKVVKPKAKAKVKAKAKSKKEGGLFMVHCCAHHQLSVDTVAHQGSTMSSAEESTS